jgi:antitoxin component of MazEF toxin-antitoxin module
MNTFIVQVKKIGNSYYLRFPKKLMSSLKVSPGEYFICYINSEFDLIYRLFDPSKLQSMRLKRQLQ